MKRMLALALLATGFLGAHAGAAPPAFAAERTVTLEVPMSCPTCPYIVKRSLQQTAGVLDVSVSYEAQTATVRYDDEQTTVAYLTQATADVGFPSKLAPSDQSE